LQIWPLRGPRRGIVSLNCTLQIKIFCVFINCATKLQYKYQYLLPKLHRLIGNYFSGGANLQQ